MRLRRIALGAAVAALVVVALLVLVAAVVDQAPPERRGTDPTAHDAGHAGRASSGGAPDVPSSWGKVHVGRVSYAVPPGWSRRSAGERVAYREDGAVIAAGRGQALLSLHGCPVAWAVLADPVHSSNVAGVAEATARAWARGYAGLPAVAGLAASPARGARGGGVVSRVRVGLGEAAGCAGERAELAAVARRDGAQVVTLVVARYLGVPGTPRDSAYDGVLGSLGVE